MIIIVEGIDRVGKTTLCNKLSKAINYKIIKNEREAISTPDAMSKYVNRENALINYGSVIDTINLANKGILKNAIFDRFHWTEAVYGYIDRDCVTSYYFMKKAEQKMQRDKFLIVYVQPTDVKESSRQHGTSLVKHLDMYKQLAKETKLNCMVCDYNSIDTTINKILDMLVAD